MNQFDEETRLQPDATGPAGAADDGRGAGAAAPADAGRYTGHVHPSWNIGTNPNGGYLMALAVAGLRMRAPQHPDPLSVTVHYLRPGLGGARCDVDARILRSGRTLSTGRATLIQDGTARLEVLAALGDLGDPAAPGGAPASGAPPAAAIEPPMPAMPPPQDCVARSGDAQGVVLPILDRVEVRLHPDEAGAGAAGRAQVTGWIRFRDGRPPDALAALLFADAFPPSVFGLLGMVGWVPTIELTVHVRRRPAPGWMLGRFTTADLADGRMIEDGALWDSAGRLVAQSRQLALLRSR